MSLALILAASLATGAAEPPVKARTRGPGNVQVDRSLSDSERLNELDRAIRLAYAKGRIDRETARELHVAVGRARRNMFRMGMQVGYRQRVRLRERIDGLYARLAARQAAIPADVRSEK